MISNEGEGAGALTSSPSPSASPLPPRKGWQALAGDLKTSWYFETSVRSTVTQLVGGSGEQHRNVGVFSPFSHRDNLQVGKHGKGSPPLFKHDLLKKKTKPEQKPQRSAAVRTKSR